MRTRIIFGAWLCACSVAACASGPGAASGATRVATSPDAVVVLRDVTVIDGTGAAPLEHRSVTIAGERIRAIEPDGSTTPPPGAAVITLPGRTLVPGLISAHSHLGMVDGTTARAANGTRENILRQVAQYEAYGVTTITSLGFNGSVFYELQPQLHRGELSGADVLGADRGIGIERGAPPVEAGPDNLYRVATPEEARAAVVDTATRHPDLVKIWVDDFHGSLPVKMDAAVYRAIIDEAHRQKLRVAAHVFYLDDAKALVAAGVDILAHGVRDRAVDAELIEALRARHVWYVPTLGLDESFYVFAQHPEWLHDPLLEHALQPPLAAQLADAAWRAKVLGDEAKLRTDEAAAAVNRQNLKALFDAGVALGFGTDSGATPLRVPGFAEHHELQLLVAAGLQPLAALRIATSQTAELLGLQDRGVLAAGKLADFSVVQGDPSRRIEDLAKLEQVWHRGRKVRGPIDTFAP